MKALAVIPARGGSKRIPRKNVRFMAGRPLIYYAIEHARSSECVTDVVVSTDDPEISYYAELFGAKVRHRPSGLCGDEITLDPVIWDAVSWAEEQGGTQYDWIITLQPTCPTLRKGRIDEAVSLAISTASDSVMTAVDDTHLFWGNAPEGGFSPRYEKRLNSQYLPRMYKETGSVVVSRRGIVHSSGRLGDATQLLIVTKEESIDIDTHFDWWIAEKQLNRRKIVLRVDGSNEIGMGHIYRCLLLAGHLIDHELLFVCDESKPLGLEKIRSQHYPVATIRSHGDFLRLLSEAKPDIVINDILDTKAADILAMKNQGIFVCNLEDLGTGSKEAHLVINEIYEIKGSSPHILSGEHYYCLRDEFRLYPKKSQAQVIDRILVTFGGTDPADLTQRVVSILATMDIPAAITVVLGLGYQNPEKIEMFAQGCGKKMEVLRNIPNMAQCVDRADLAITSGGRTVYEVASLATPLIVIAQNERELTHTFARIDNGIVNLGLHASVSDDEIRRSILRMFEDKAFVQECIDRMRSHALTDGIWNLLSTLMKEYKKYEKSLG